MNQHPGLGRVSRYRLIQAVYLPQFAFRFLATFSVYLLCQSPWPVLAASIPGVGSGGAAAVSATPPDSPVKATGAASASEEKLPAGAEEYNKGCELFSIAKIQASKGNTDGEKQLLKEAVKHFETALQQNPKLVDAQSNIAFVSLTRREYRKAIGTFEKALLLNSKHVNSLNGLATSYALAGDTTQSIQTFDKLILLTPGNSEVYFNKGSVLQKAGRLPDARKAYEEAIRIQPNYQFALFNLGTLLENQGDLAGAKPYYERAKSADIGNAAGLESLHRLEAINNALAKKGASQ